MENKSRILFFLGVFILYFVFFMGFFFLFESYIHETGHIIFGFADGLLKGQINNFTISAFVKHPFFQFIPLPQQTKIIGGNGSLNFAMGGPLFMIFVFLGLSILGYSLSKNKGWFLIFISILLFEVSGNIICGTDNWTNNPLSFCNHSLDLSLQYLAIFLFSGTLSYFTTKKLEDRLLRNN